MGGRDPEFPASSSETTDMAVELFLSAMLQGMRNNTAEAGEGATCTVLMYDGDHGSAFSTRLEAALSGNLEPGANGTSSSGPSGRSSAAGGKSKNAAQTTGKKNGAKKSNGTGAESSSGPKAAAGSSELPMEAQALLTGTKRMCWHCGNLFERPEHAIGNAAQSGRRTGKPATLQDGGSACCCRDCGLAWYCNADCMYAHRVEHLTEECGGRLRRLRSADDVEPDVEPERGPVSSSSGPAKKPITAEELVECVVFPADGQQKPYARLIPKDPVKAAVRLRKLLGATGTSRDGKASEVLEGCDGKFRESEFLFTRPERGFMPNGPQGVHINDVGVVREGLWLVQRNWPKQLRGRVTSGASSSPSDSSVRALGGGFVRVKDLASAEGKKLNGKIGRLTGEYSADTGRFQVEFGWESRKATTVAAEGSFDKSLFANVKRAHEKNLAGVREARIMEECRVKGMELMVITSLKVIEAKRDEPTLVEMGAAIAGPPGASKDGKKAVDVAIEKCCGGTLKPHAVAALADIAERPPHLAAKALAEGRVRKLLKGENLELVECDSAGKIVLPSESGTGRSASDDMSEEILHKLGVPEANARASCVMSVLDLQDRNKVNTFQIGNENLGVRARGDVIALRYRPEEVHPRGMRPPQQGASFARANDFFQLAPYERELKKELTHAADPELTDFTFRMYQLLWGIFQVMPMPKGVSLPGLPGRVGMGTVMADVPGMGEHLGETMRESLGGGKSSGNARRAAGADKMRGDTDNHMAVLQEEWGKVFLELPGAEAAQIAAAFLGPLLNGGRGGLSRARTEAQQRRRAEEIEKEFGAGGARGPGGVYMAVRQLSSCYLDHMLTAGRLDPSGATSLAQAMDAVVHDLERKKNATTANRLKEALKKCESTTISEILEGVLGSSEFLAKAGRGRGSRGDAGHLTEPQSKRAAGQKLTAAARDREAKKLIGATVKLHSLSAEQHNGKMGVVKSVVSGGERLEIAVDDDKDGSCAKKSLRVKYINLSLDSGAGSSKEAHAAAELLGAVVSQVFDFGAAKRKREPAAVSVSSSGAAGDNSGAAAGREDDEDGASSGAPTTAAGGGGSISSPPTFSPPSRAAAGALDGAPVSGGDVDESPTGRKSDASFASAISAEGAGRAVDDASACAVSATPGGPPPQPMEEIDDEVRVSILKAASVILRDAVSKRLPVAHLLQKLREEEPSLMESAEAIGAVGGATSGGSAAVGGASSGAAFGRSHWLVKLLTNAGNSALESTHATYTHSGMCVALGEGGALVSLRRSGPHRWTWCGCGGRGGGTRC